MPGGFCPRAARGGVGRIRDVDGAGEGGAAYFAELEALKGRLKGHYAVSVSGNWRVTFRFEEGEAVDVNYVDYH